MNAQLLNEELADRTLRCRCCNTPFVFSRAEQTFFLEKGLQNDPKSCPDCRVRIRAIRNGKGSENCAVARCAECGLETVVPFVPKGYSPVYCTPCHLIKRRERQMLELPNKSA